MKLYRSDWIGILIGVAMGLYQPFAILNKLEFPELQGEALIPVMLFGLIGPPLLALVAKYILRIRSPLQDKIGRFIGKYVNAFFLVIAYGISTGVAGLAYHLIIGLPGHTLMPIIFFSSAGFGFLAAYFVQPELAYRPNDQV